MTTPSLPSFYLFLPLYLTQPGFQSTYIMTVARLSFLEISGSGMIVPFFPRRWPAAASPRQPFIATSTDRVIPTVNSDFWSELELDFSPHAFTSNTVFIRPHIPKGRVLSAYCACATPQLQQHRSHPRRYRDRKTRSSFSHLTTPELSKITLPSTHRSGVGTESNLARDGHLLP